MNTNNLSNLLVQNPDVLLSCASIENDSGGDGGGGGRVVGSANSHVTTNPVNYDHSYSMLNDESNQQQLVTFSLASSNDTQMISDSYLSGNTANTERQFSFDQFIQQDEVSLESQREIRDEILGNFLNFLKF